MVEWLFSANWLAVFSALLIASAIISGFSCWNWVYSYSA